jgi:radical SAM superfamily enzyme YgiQ (UPF0313 family)
MSHSSEAARRLLLVYPASEALGWVRRFQLPSLALRQVATATPDDWDVVLADEVHEGIPFGETFDVVGITAMTQQAHRAYEVSDRFRAQGVPVVLGGMHPTVLPDEALQHADAVVIGEAEPVWAGLLADLLMGRLAPVYRAPIPDREDLVIPRTHRDVFARRRYLTTQTLQASRGCPYDCPFCTTTKYFGHLFRYRPAEDTLAELRSYDRKLVIFLDDNLLGNPRRAVPILEGMAELGLRWGGQTTLKFAEDKALVRLVARSGCIGLFVGIESVGGPNASLSKSRSSVPQKELVRRVQEAGILVETSFVFGFDDHDESVFETTLQYARDLSASIPTFHILTPYPGTVLFRQFEADGRLLHQDWNRYNHNEVVFHPKQMTPDRLYRGWVETRKEAYSWSSILSRVLHNPNPRLTNLAYNVLRKGPNDHLPASA